MDSIYSKLEKNKKPRVHIQYEVETEGGVIKKELPFVVGVMGDFSADGEHSKKPLAEKKFTQIDRDNFDQVMKKMRPTLYFHVENKISSEGGTLPINLKFNCLTDFEPENIASQVPVIKKLLDTRNKLRDLITQVDISEDLESLLEEIFRDDINFNTDETGEISTTAFGEKNGSN